MAQVLAEHDNAVQDAQNRRNAAFNAAMRTYTISCVIALGAFAGASLRCVGILTWPLVGEILFGPCMLVITGVLIAAAGAASAMFIAAIRTADETQQNAIDAAGATYNAALNAAQAARDYEAELAWDAYALSAEDAEYRLAQCWRENGCAGTYTDPPRP